MIFENANILIKNFISSLVNMTLYIYIYSRKGPLISVFFVFLYFVVFRKDKKKESFIRLKKPNKNENFIRII